MDLKSSIRPKELHKEDGICGLCNGGGLNGVDSDADVDVEESIKVKSVTDVYLPSQLEIDEHNLNHLPFRNWCPYCVQGKAVAGHHRRRRLEESAVPVISMDSWD